MDQIITNIKNFAKTIKHCGDYGETFYNSKTKQIHWAGGDGDGYNDPETLPTDPEYLTPFEEIESGFMAIEGVDSVVIADEYFPGENDDEDQNGISDDWKEVYSSYEQDLDDIKQSEIGFNANIP